MHRFQKKYSTFLLIGLLVSSFSISEPINFLSEKKTYGYNSLSYQVESFFEVSNNAQISYQINVTSIGKHAVFCLIFRSKEKDSLTLNSVQVDPGNNGCFFIPYLSSVSDFDVPGEVYLLNSSCSSNCLPLLEILPDAIISLMFPEIIFGDIFLHSSLALNNTRRFAGKISLNFLQGTIEFSATVIAYDHFLMDILKPEPTPFYLIVWFGFLVNLVVIPLLVSIELIIRKKKKQKAQDLKHSSNNE